ncbi:hypothetical protein PR003_g4347 [Phytophthora rubi]|uniref:Uncharacterized protein n=1 Tax=Phytophthora rubi TaxID=129364 RepID=A0A6A3NXA7_9STRA|nr:hypothetical protein PR002_g2586 [Phytophthora rubi]KAE9047705.1 hypothetical protein PR001_g4098 [Phytophthora rubi]KAE9352523.1 hypothetical protein PR003_g4347 [Phytophthora rubi]
MFGFVKDFTPKIYLWMRWIITRNLPVTEVENKLTREVVTLKPIAVRTQKTYMRFVVGKVGQTVATEMGESFGLMFDGWTCNSLHFLGTFAVYVVGHGTSGLSHFHRWTAAKRPMPILSTLRLR